MSEVPSYVRHHVDDLERALARTRAKAEELRALPPSSENLEALQAIGSIAESIERTLAAAKTDPAVLDPGPD